jgi:glycogen synthase
VNFGGVAQVVAALASGFTTQLRGTRVFVLLPHYGFILKTSVIAQFEYRMPKGMRKVSISALELGDVTFILLGAPSHHPKLWSSMKVEDIYNIKHHSLGHQISPTERDLHFSFVAAHAIQLISSLGTRSEQGVFVHVHGATNAPIGWFLRNSYFQKALSVRILYTIHDYNSEPYVIYDGAMLEKFQQSQGKNTRASFRVLDRIRGRRNQKLFLRMCTSETNQSNLALTKNYYYGSANMLDCFDAVTTVSEGMIPSLLKTHSAMARSIIELQNSHRLHAITNWVSNRTWQNARDFVSLENPAKDKLIAKQNFFSVFDALQSTSSQPDATSCSVLWLGRFEANKGLRFIPNIYSTACQFGCYLILAGYSTTTKQNNLLQKVLEKTALQKDCPLFVIKDKTHQDRHGHLIRSSADIIVVPSSAEAYGLVAAEALAYGTIPVVSNVGGLPEVVSAYPESDWTGFTFNFFDDEELTSHTLKFTLAKALNAYQAARKGQSLNLLQRRIIHSTPRGGGEKEMGASILKYIALMKKLRSLP